MNRRKLASLFGIAITIIVAILFMILRSPLDNLSGTRDNPSTASSSGSKTSVGKLPQGWMNIKPPGQTTSLVLWRGNLIAGDERGVYRLRLSDGMVLEKYKQSVMMEYVRMVFADRYDKLWVCHVNGISEFDGSRWINYSKKNGLPDNRVNCVLQTKSGIIWAGTDKGAAIFNGRKWKAFTEKDGLLVSVVNVIIEHENGSMFFGSNISPQGGISCLYQGKWQYFDIKNGLPHNQVNVLYEDRNGSIWAGTGYMRNGGACRFDFVKGKWTIGRTVFKEDGLAGEKVCSIFEQENGIIWFGSEFDGIAFNKGIKWDRISPSQGLAGTEVKSLLYDTFGTMWFATPGGITRLTPDALAKVTIKVIPEQSNAE